MDLNLVAFIFSLLVAVVTITWTIAKMMGKMKVDLIKGQGDIKLDFFNKVNMLKEYTDSKLVPLEKRVSFIEGELSIKNKGGQ